MIGAVPTDAGVRPQRRVADAGAILIVYASLLLLVPSTMVVGPLGASGTPANLVGMGMVWLWVVGRLHPNSHLAGGSQPVRTALLVFAAAVVASCGAAAFRPIGPIETAALDRGVMVLLGCTGVTLLAADGIADRAQLDKVLGWLVALATVVAIAGIVQFVVGFDVKHVLRFPGLRENLVTSGIEERSIFRRVAGTTAHPIEFAVVLAVIFPLALHRSLFAQGTRPLRRWGPLAAIGLGLPMSLSRSGFVALAVAMAALLPTWPPERRRRGLAVGAAFLVATRFAVPGLLGTVKSLFMNLGGDPSIDGRTEDYAVLGRYFWDTPIFGRGFFTFLPDHYTTFDNQYLLSLVDIGMVGTIALVALLVVGMGTARGSRRRSADEETRHLGQALAASLAGVAVGYGTFDALSFPTIAGVTFLLLGLAGAAGRLARTAPPAADGWP